ncbi:MAG: hypothetical protein ACYDA6_11220 [Solirubrobacteraceae bacterium]
MYSIALRLLLSIVLLALAAHIAHPLLSRAEHLPAPLGSIARGADEMGATLDALSAGPSPKQPLCHYHGALPDPRCTPGAVFTHVSLSTICAYGYTSRARDVSEVLKRHIYAEYGIKHHRPGAFEVDHFVPLDINGSNEEANLWPQPAPAYHVKDRLEAALGAAVCAHRVSIGRAQQAIAVNWQTAWARLGSGR